MLDIESNKTYSLHLPINSLLEQHVLAIKRLKVGIWLYIMLLIFEGGIRKWLLPSLATPLLIVRDPIALWLLVMACREGLLKANPYLTGMILVGVISIFTTLFMGHRNLGVALFGARILLIHFPLIFVIGKIFDHSDVIKTGRFLLSVAILMTVLISLQFFSPQSAWVNRGVGGDMAGSGFSGALDYYRPSGTFSFSNGLTIFYCLVACYIIYFWLHPQSVNSMLLIGATVCLLAAIPLSISRGLLFQILISVLFACVATIRTPKYLLKLFFAVAMVAFVLIVLGNVSFFEKATAAFSSRFELANKVEGGLEGVLVDRYLGGMIGALTSNDNLPFFGRGLGLGTNVGAMLLYGKTEFLISEGEWGRLIGEMGILLGLSAIVIRLGICIKFTVASIKRMNNGQILPWLLLSFALFQIPQGQWSQPTSLGFSVIIGGLLLASFRTPSSESVIRKHE